MVASIPQRLRQLGQIQHPTAPRTARGSVRPPRCFRPWTKPSSRPGPASRCAHLVNQAEPSSSFDAVAQRRHHAIRPYRSFHPRHVAGFCALHSPRGHSGALCASVLVFTHPPSYPPWLGPVLQPGFSRLSPHRYYEALTPAGLAHDRQVSPLTPLHLRASRPQHVMCPKCRFVSQPQRIRSDPLRSSASPCDRRLATTPRRNRFVLLRATRSPPVASHPASRRRSYLRLRAV